jgi:membrane-associated protease RseP (regulator of RpoE activity)
MGRTTIRLIRPLLAGLAVLGAAGACAARDDGAPAGGPATVPFELLPSNHMLVVATLNGEGPFRLIFDLGSPVTLLGGKAAERSGAIPKDAPKALLFGVRGEGRLKEIALGDVTAKDLPVVVMDHPALKALGGALGKPLDGILGYTFFARYRTTIDYQKKQMTFAPVAFEVKDLLKDIEGRMIGPKVAKSRIAAPTSLWGVEVGAAAGGVAAEGVPVGRVAADSPAAAAGLRPGDTLVSIDGRWTTTPTDTHDAAAAVPAGRPVPVVVLRDGERLTLTVTPRDGI